MRNSTASRATATGQAGTTVTVQTGGTCQVSGPYRASRHTDIVILFKQGDKFPVDPIDGRSTSWTLTRQ